MAKRGFWQKGRGAEIIAEARKRLDKGDDPDGVFADAAKAASRVLREPVTPKNVRDALWRVDNPDYHRGTGGRRGGRAQAGSLPSNLLQAVDAAAAVLQPAIRARIDDLEAQLKQAIADRDEAIRERDTARAEAAAARDQLNAVERSLTNLRLSRAGGVHGE